MPTDEILLRLVANAIWANERGQRALAMRLALRAHVRALAKGYYA